MTAAGIGQGGIRLAQQDAPLRINSGSNTGPGFCFLDGASAPMTDAQLAALYPTVQSYVDKVVANDGRQRRGGLHPEGLHARSGLVHGHPRRGQRQRRADRQRRREPDPR